MVVGPAMHLPNTKELNKKVVRKVVEHHLADDVDMRGEYCWSATCAAAARELRLTLY
jgi:hypothetical protein